MFHEVEGLLQEGIYPQKELVMFLVGKLMIFGWTTWLALFGFFALRESGKLLQIKKRVALWLENSAHPVVISRPEQSLQPESQEVA